MKIISIYLILINLLAFITMHLDKQRALKKEWRIPEKTLFFIVWIGGSIGGILGMNVFHHKTRHWQFKYGFPIILIIQITVTYLLWINK